MDVTAKSEIAREVGEFIEDHQGQDTRVIQVSGVSSWTDFFVISTVKSMGHLKGLLKHVQNYLSQNNIKVFHRQKKIQEEGWILVDCGFMVIHLMNESMREFYELEKLWYAGETLYQSSKSS